jgi:hypothetical protein
MIIKLGNWNNLLRDRVSDKNIINKLLGIEI